MWRSLGTLRLHLRQACTAVTLLLLLRLLWRLLYRLPRLSCLYVMVDNLSKLQLMNNNKPKEIPMVLTMNVSYSCTFVHVSCNSVFDTCEQCILVVRFVMA